MLPCTLVFPVDASPHCDPSGRGHRAGSRAELIPSRVWKMPHGGFHVAVNFQQTEVVCKIRILIWKVDPI